MSSKNILSFSLGAAAGSLVTYILLKDRCTIEVVEHKPSASDPDDDFYEEAKQGVYDYTKEVKRKAEEAQQKPDLVDYAKKLVREHKYDQALEGSEGSEESEEKEENAIMGGPYVIKPEEFGCTEEDYDLIELTYYADGILADGMDEMVEDVDFTVGLDSLSTFGQYEDDSVFVRNDRLKTDFEIIRSDEKYMDIIRRQNSEDEEE